MKYYMLIGLVFWCLPYIVYWHDESTTNEFSEAMVASFWFWVAWPIFLLIVLILLYGYLFNKWENLG